MAQVNTESGGQRGGRAVSKTLSPRVDMTPMVDLMFLLITFFMLTTSLRKQYAMSLTMPVDTDIKTTIPDNRTLNLCLGKNNLLLWYMGNDEKPLTKPVSANFSMSELRKTLLKVNADVLKATGKGVIVLIKPGATSKYKNLVNVLDELKIAGLDTYSVADVSATDVGRMKVQDVY